MRRVLALILLASGCAPAGELFGSQPAIQAHLVVHVDPMSRTAGEDCLDPSLSRCGQLAREPWKRRTRNLTWLAQTWIPAGRTVDVQLGPEAARAWAGHPESLAVLGEGAASTAEEGMCALEQLVGSGQASLGLHMHSELPDGDQAWGTLKVTARNDPCAASADDPIEEVPPHQVEALVHYGATSVHPIAKMLGTSIGTFTAHVPRSMTSKIAVLEDPDAIDTKTAHSFPDTFEPYTLGSAYSECYQHAVDHPPFEVYATGGTAALSVGEGPMVIPGNRVVGSMAPHLGQDSDGSLEAARRRLLQLLLNWRVAGLEGQSDRPWVFTFHAHLFDLESGSPDPWDPDGRQLTPNQGHPFREEVEALARTVDHLGGHPAWRGVGGEAGVIDWTLPADLSTSGSHFGDDADGEGPYLPLVTERLADSHLVCSRAERDFDYFELDRCPGGWAWGGDDYGQHCSDGGSAQSITVIVSDVGGCAPGSHEGLQVGSVDGERMTSPLRCPGGLVVPQAGLIVERRDGRPWRADLCQRGGAAVLQP